MVEVAAGTREHAHAIPSIEQAAREVSAQESTGACDEDFQAENLGAASYHVDGSATIACPRQRLTFVLRFPIARSAST